MFNQYLKQVKETFYYSLPLIAGQIGQMLFGTGDIMVAGRYSTEVVAALGIAAAILGSFIMVGLSITYAIGSLTAQQIGQNANSKSMLLTSHAFALVLAGVLFAILSAGLNYIYLLDLSPDLTSLVEKYLRITNYSLFPVLFFQVSKEYLQAYSKTFFSNILILIFLGLNIGINIVLMFGKYGFPEMGIAGAAYATNICRYLMAFILFIYLLQYENKKSSLNFIFQPSLFLRIVKIGLPIAVGTFVEVLVFTTVTVLIGRIGTMASAAHNIVLNLASLTFMLPLSFNSAAGVQVGLEYGRKNAKGILLVSLATVSLSTTCMTLTAICYLLFPTTLLSFFTNDPSLIAEASGLIIFVALFQIPDGLQITLWGILRGLNTTKAPMVISFLGNWLFGLPIGYYLAFQRGMQSKGLWAGLAIGLTTISLGLLFLFKKRYQYLKLNFNSSSP